MLQTFMARCWDEVFSTPVQQQSVNQLEDGHILFFPELSYSLTAEESFFLSPEHADPHAKNISYHQPTRKLWGVQRLDDKQRQKLAAMLDRFSQKAYRLIQGILPAYAPQVEMGRTSYRPVQVCNRKTSCRKDDKRLHVDSFPSAPNQGKRILRVFCNINPHGEDRVWRTGEHFTRVAEQFLPGIPKPFPGKAGLLQILNITKSYRTLYDHYMLQMHDRMKANEHYQQHAEQQEVRFPPGSTWIVQTDHVSHAAMSGQYLLEQTFYLPVSAMVDESKSPLRVLESKLGQPLV